MGAGGLGRVMRAVAQTWAMLLLALAMPALAQPSPIDTASRELAGAETDLAAVDSALDGKVDRAGRADLRTRALAAQSDARDAADQLRGQLALVDARARQFQNVARLYAATAGGWVPAETMASR